MNRRIVILVLAGCFATGIIQVMATPLNGINQDQKQPKKEPSKGAASMTGCIDEQEGHYVLIDDRTRDLVADLQADGFETEGFAKHVGHKVTVRGTSNPGGTRPLFKVRAIETISETCAPQGVK